MKKALSLILCVVMMLSCAFTLISCGEDGDLYEFDSIKINKITIGGEDYTAELRSAIVESFPTEEFEDVSIVLGSKKISFKKTGEKTDKYGYTLEENEIVIKDKGFYEEAANDKTLKNGEFVLIKNDDTIEWVVKGDVVSEGITIHIDMSYVFEKQDKQ